MFAEYFEAAEKHVRSIGKTPEIRRGRPVTEEQLDDVQRLIERPIPGELRAYFQEMGDGYSFSPAEGHDGFMIGWLGDYRYKVAGFVDALRFESQPERCHKHTHEIIERELARRERWFPFYNFDGGGYMFCLDLNESPAPITYYERVWWPNDAVETWGFRVADSFLDMVQHWSRFCFSDVEGHTLISFASGMSGRFDWAPSRFNSTYDRGTT